MIDTENEKTRFEKIYTKYCDSLIKYANLILDNEDASYDAVTQSFAQ